MILTRKSSAWVLAGLQAAFSLFFTRHLLGLTALDVSQVFDGPSWLSGLTLLNFGLTLLLGFCALWSHEITALLLLAAIHIVCPILFFTDLTRNPYFTQIVLLNIWTGFIWIAWLWECWRNNRLLIPRTNLDLPLAAFLAAATLTWGLSFFTHPAAFHPSMTAEGLRNWIFLTLNCVAVFYIAVMMDDAWRRRFIWITFWIGGLAAAYGLMQFYGMEQIWSKTLTPFANRPVSTFGNPNFLSSYLLLLVPLLLLNLMTNRKKGPLLFSFLLLVVIVTGLIATMTRSTWVGALAAVAFLPLAPSAREFLRRNAKRFGIVVLVLLASVLFWPKSKLGGYANPLDRILEIRNINNPNGYGPWHQRMLIWSACWMMVQDHPLTGKGYGQLELFYPYYQGKLLFNPLFRSFRTHANNGHNEIMEIWSQTGIAGMGVYVWLWVVLVLFGMKCSLRFYESDPERSLWAWALTAGSLGMLLDNILGNVSLHFAVPAFLFWWQAGLLFSLERKDFPADKPHPALWRVLPLESHWNKTLALAALVFFAATGLWHYRREFQEIYYFRGFKISKTTNQIDQARAELEEAWRWYPREVNSNYELSNAYARLSLQTHQAGLTAQSENWRKKAIWAYLESLRSNCGYDEIYFNLAAVQAQMGWLEDGAKDLVLENPRGLPITESALSAGGAVYNFSRALAINPLNEEGYNYLGNLFLQNRERYHDQAVLLYEKAARVFPRNKDFWINLAYLHVQKKNYDAAYAALYQALTLDPFNELTRRNLRSLLAQSGRPNDPLAQADRNLSQFNALIQSKNWAELKKLCEPVVKILPGNLQLRFILGNVYFELAQFDKAEAEYGEALKLDPRNLMVLNNLALTYKSLNRPEEARKIYRRMIEINPDDPLIKKQLEAAS